MRFKLALIIIFILITFGCSRTEREDTKDKSSEHAEVIEKEEVVDSTETIKELPLHHVESTKENNYEIEIIEFDLGKKEYFTNAGKIMPYRIRGIMGVPKGEGPFPLLLISHGSHSNDDESKRFDTGFDYLVKDLAENGFITVSMDMSMPYIWKYGDNDDHEKSIPVANNHIESLILANEGNDPGYGTDLKGKINFKQMGLIGHSRGGETIFDIANEQRKRGIDIKAILSIAPTFLFEREWVDADIAILVPEFDGDVSGLDGINMYKALNLHTKNFNSVTVLRKANHNYFNRNIERNDATMLRSEEELLDQLSREEQEEFLKNFAVDFFTSSLLNQESSFLSPLEMQPNKLYGFDVKTMYRRYPITELIDSKVMNQFHGEGAFIAAKKDSWYFKHDEILIDTVTGGRGDIEDLDDPYMIKPLINIIWEDKDSKAVITPNISDFSGFDGLTFNIVIDSASDLNKKDVSQQFTIELKDSTGNTSRVVLPENLNALAYVPGEIGSTDIIEHTIEYWTRTSPVSSINIPLTEFEGVDLKNIDSISLVFDKTSSGAIYVEAMYLQ